MKSIKCAGLIICLLLFAKPIMHAQIHPQQSGSKYIFTFDSLYFAVDASRGGRIISFQYNGTELFYLLSSQDMNGSTFWPSPQSIWGWPPLPNIDNKNYQIKTTNNKLLITSNIDPSLHIRVHKCFVLDTVDTTVVINYYIKNEGLNAIKLAPWEITRVPLDGPVVFRLEDGQVTGELASQTTEIDSYIWYDQQNTNGAGSKFFANGMGWLAYLNFNKKLIFLKKFPDISTNFFAPSESEIEVYTAGDRSYTELENQGKYVAISAQDSIIYAVRWAIRKIPSNIPLEIGNSTLTTFIDSLARHFRYADTIPFSITTPVTSISTGERSIYYTNGQIRLFNFLTTDFPMQLSIFDASGRSIWREQVPQPLVTFSLQHLPKGFYFLRLQDSKQRQFTKKVIFF